MSRNLFDGMLGGTEENVESIDYKTPEERLTADTALAGWLVEHYKDGRVSGARLTQKYDFESLSKELKSVIGNSGAEFCPQTLVDLLTVELSDESDGVYYYARTMYLTALVQALYDLNRGSEFTIDIRNWPKPKYHWMEKYDVGNHLRAGEDKPLTLNLYGDWGTCAHHAEHCKIIVHGKVKEWLAPSAKHSSFTIYDKVNQSCGSEAENCIFNLMPGAEVQYYIADYNRGNRERILNAKDEVMKIRTIKANLDCWMKHRRDSLIDLLLPP